MFYTKHIFFCCNKKANDSGCGLFGGEVAFNYTRYYLKQNNLWGEGKLRASKSLCLGRCENAPVCVVYPDGVWYSYVDDKDLQQIIDEHLLGNKVVKRLQI